jgi:hypothetical protein
MLVPAQKTLSASELVSVGTGGAFTVRIAAVVVAFVPPPQLVILHLYW